MLVLTRKAAEFVKVVVDGKCLVTFCFAPLGRIDGFGIRGAYFDGTELETFELSLEQPALLPGLPADCQTTVSMLSVSMGNSKARLGIEGPDHVEYIRNELEDGSDTDGDDSDEAQAA